MSIKWVGTISLVALFGVFVILPIALVCGPTLELLGAFVLGALVSLFLFAATENHEDMQPTVENYPVAASDLDLQCREQQSKKRKKATGYAILAIAFWIPYVITLFSLGWTTWWWILPVLFFLVSLVIVLDLAGTILCDNFSTRKH